MTLDADLSRNESVLLSVRLENSDVKLRIDRNGLAQPSFREPPIVELTCIGCNVSAALISRLSQGVDKSLYYEFSRQEGSFNLLLTIDNSIDEAELGCQDVREEFHEYTQADLLQKCRRLGGLYLMRDKELYIVEHSYNIVLAELRNALIKEVDVCARKAPFFARSWPEKAVEVIGNAQAYEKALYLLGWEMDHLNKMRGQ